jgi:hypothetical protein
MLRREPWLIVMLGLFGLFCVLSAGLVGYWRYANQLPVYPTPQVAMPVPNAYDDYVAAGQMSQAVGGASVQMPALRSGSASFPPPGGISPLATPRTNTPVQAYEPNVPLDQVRAVVTRNGPALARLRQGFRKEYRSPPVISFNQPLPELATYRELARVLLTEGKLAEREGRPADAMRSYLDCLRLGVDVPRGGPLIHGLVGIAVQAIGLGAMQGVVDQLDARSATAAARQMAKLDAQAASAADTLLSEKEAYTAEIAQVLRNSSALRQFTGSVDGPPMAAQSLEGGVRFALTPKKRMIDDYRVYMDALAANARRPYYAQLPAPLPTDPINRAFLPLFDNVHWKWAVRDAQWRIVELRLAARAYRLEHGTPPPSLSALAPACLPAVPQDPFAPKPLVFRRNGAGTLIYSRGPDGVDDGGRDVGRQSGPSSSGDIVAVGSRP